MAAQFSHVAEAYDAQFTHTAIGKLQRAQVYKELKKIIAKNQSVLELNCGTGEDALWLSNNVQSILATDISAEMLAVAKEKAVANSNITFEVVDCKKIECLLPKTFDIIFSNFGGLNCLSPDDFQDFLQKIGTLLNPKGALVLVIMGKKTLWERLYFGLKNDRKNANRRNTSHAVFANVEGKKVPTFYYAPSDVSRQVIDFQLKKIVPIGLFVPPSYMQNFFASRNWALQILNFLEHFRASAFANYADHFLVHLEKKNE